MGHLVEDAKTLPAKSWPWESRPSGDTAIGTYLYLPPRNTSWQLTAKYALDRFLAAVALVALAPFVGVLAVAVKLDSQGPAFYVQVRTGYRGSRFRLYKLRTMHPGADALTTQLVSQNIYPDTRLFKIVDDPRVTRFGKWLRKTSLDELPQFYNVLRGEMSIVGPRPPLPSEVEQYSSQDMLRLLVKPGITGPWQVSGRSTVKEFDAVVALERNYIENWSLWKDIRILLKTVPVVLRMIGAH